MSSLTERAKRFREAIAAFIEARREAKLKGTDDEGDTAPKYNYETWLGDAARRVGQIQAVTHVLKATHPDARGSSLHIAPDALPQHTEIGTHSLGNRYAEDVVGNAAALDVFKFLKVEVEGRRLLDWMQANDTDLRRALHEDDATATNWMRAFSGLVRSDSHASSHEAAKQLYWLAGDDASDDHHFHLLQPLFSSSLAHAVHEEVQEARFGEANKAARQAHRDKKPHDATYRDYAHLAVRKLGGTKPQNISQLNSDRHGLNYLLASLPPKWKQQPLNLLHLESTMDRLDRFEGVRPLLQELAAFLKSDPPPTVETRIKREGIEQALGAYLPAFAESIHATHEPGWTRSPDCNLPLCEQLWLDPGRLQLSDRTDTEQHQKADAEFKAAYDWGDWPDEVAGRFANWVNARLRDSGVPALGDAEYQHWAKQAIVDAAWPVPVQRRAPKGAAA